MSWKDSYSLNYKDRPIKKCLGFEPSSASKDPEIVDKIEMSILQMESGLESKLHSKLLCDFDSIFQSKMDERIEAKIKPLQSKVSELEAENRRMKIALRFLESELKESKMKSKIDTNLKSSDPKKRLYSVKELIDLPQSDPKKLKLLEDKPNDGKNSLSRILAEYTKLPDSIDKIKIANEEKTQNLSSREKLLDSTKSPQERTITDLTQSKETRNQLYLAIPSSNNSSSLVPLVLQSSRPESSRLSAKKSPDQVNASVNGIPHAACFNVSTPPAISAKPRAKSGSSYEKTGTPAVATSGTEDISEPKDDDEIEVVPPPPPKSPLAVIDLSDEEGEPTNYEISEILPGPECHMHPMVSPVLPFAVADEKLMSPPTLKARTGRGKDGKKAVVLRMESKISGVQNLQYRVFSYFENASELVKDRRWKQLTCIKVQSGRVCECTLTHLMEKVRYHFVVCLVQGNNRSKFSNCAPHVY